MKIVIDVQDGFDIKCGPYGSSRIGLEHEGIIIAWGAWGGDSQVLKEIKRRWDLAETSNTGDSNEHTD